LVVEVYKDHLLNDNPQRVLSAKAQYGEKRCMFCLPWATPGIEAAPPMWFPGGGGAKLGGGWFGRGDVRLGEGGRLFRVEG